MSDADFALTVINGQALPTHIAAENQRLAEGADELAREASAPATRRAYCSDWRVFRGFAAKQWLGPELPEGADLADFIAELRAIGPVPPQAVRMFIKAEEEAGRAVSTVTRRVAAIAYLHREAGLKSPTKAVEVENAVRGFRRRRADDGRPSKARRALNGEKLRPILEALDRETLIGKRDAALLLLGYWGAFRRSELAAFVLEDLEETPTRLRVTVRRSKTDQDAKGVVVEVPRSPDAAVCAVRAVAEWLEAAGVVEDTAPVFRSVTRWGSVSAKGISTTSIGKLVKAHARRYALTHLEKNEDQADAFAARFGAHSLRAGWVTDAKKHGLSNSECQARTRHKDERMISRYDRSERELADVGML